ncbi:MAG: cysteine desulfurase [Caldisericaceae bacterium]|nr:cysteine desulfurase [Caldisericaceae bacterium]
MEKIYFDYAANTPLDPQVRQVLMQFYEEHYGNSAGIHSFARDMREHLDRAREFFARYLGARSSEIVFTASATESNNLVFKGLAARFPEKNHLLISAVEHASVLQTALYLEKLGFEVEMIPVDQTGQLDPDEVKKRIKSNTLLVSVIWVNNELGTIQPIETIGQLCRAAGVLFHTDAVQGFAKLALNVKSFNIDFLTASAHKIYGPLGVGLLYVKQGTSLEPLLHGGGHENGLRSSTVNVPGIVAFQKAAEIYRQIRQEEWQQLASFKEAITEFVQQNIPGARINSSENSVPHILNVSFENVDGELLAILLDREGIAISTGSACSTGKLKASRIVDAIHLPQKFKKGTIRISLGRFTTAEQVEHLLQKLKTAVEKVRKIS